MRIWLKRPIRPWNSLWRSGQTGFVGTLLAELSLAGLAKLSFILRLLDAIWLRCNSIIHNDALSDVSFLSQGFPVIHSIRRASVMRVEALTGPSACSLFKNVICDLLPSITQITNMSLQSGIFPTDLKKALVTPLLKKASLDPEIKKNYRPISNLAFLGKVIERAATKQYVDYLTVNELFARSHSAYHQYHSTETALLRVCDDILRSLDKPHGEVILVLLDLTAAFDTIDHALLLQRLRQRYGIGGKVLQWFESYLHQREQSVLINTSKSDPLTMEWAFLKDP